MAVICPECNTENRDIAKFCIECVCTLPTLFAKLEFAATVPAGLKALRWKTGRREKAAAREAVLRSGRSSTSGAPAAERQPTVAPKRSVRSRRPSMAFCVIALLAGGAGGMLADAGGPTTRITTTVSAQVAPPPSAPCVDSASGTHAPCHSLQRPPRADKEKRKPALAN